MRSYIKDHKKDVLLTVHNLPAGTPVKLAVMDRFDGTVWNLSDSSEATDSSNYHRVGTTIKADEQGKSFTATFTVDQGLTEGGGVLLVEENLGVGGDIFCGGRERPLA